MCLCGRLKLWMSWLTSRYDLYLTMTCPDHDLLLTIWQLEQLLTDDVWIYVYNIKHKIKSSYAVLSFRMQ